jgi:photosystem II stability/assembly factor-like uncharacterized protein
MRALPSTRLSRGLVVQGVLLAGLAVALLGLPQQAVAASGWVVGTDTAGGFGVILHTTNGGQTWVRQGDVGAIPNVSLANVKAVDRDHAWVVGNGGTILRTSDAGVTWVQLGNATLVPDGVISGVGPVDRNTAWVVGDGGVILRTDDGGQVWIQQPSGTTANLWEVAATDSQTAWAIGDGENGYGVILHTTNGGQTWQRQGTAATLQAAGFIDLTVVDSRTAWAVGQANTVVKTSDGGASWQIQMGPGVIDNNGVHHVDANTAWIAADYNTVYRTSDGGRIWREQGLALGRNYYLLGVSALGTDAAWVVGGAVFPSQGGVIAHTPDAGVTWQIQPTPVDVTFRRVSFVKETAVSMPASSTWSIALLELAVIALMVVVGRRYVQTP